MPQMKPSLWKIGMLIIAVLAGGAIWLWHSYRQTYPFGSSHCCAKVLATALAMHAQNNVGKFPAGGPTPEASLSLLVGGEWLSDTNGALAILRGKTVSFDKVQTAWQRDGRLGPDSCGWFYVEGLREDDDRGLALAWDKYGLGHNGQRYSEGGHEVIMVDGSSLQVTGNRWDEFIELQRQLLAAHDPPLTNALNAWFTNYALRDSRREALKR